MLNKFLWFYSKSYSNKSTGSNLKSACFIFFKEENVQLSFISIGYYREKVICIIYICRREVIATNFQNIIEGNEQKIYLNTYHSDCPADILSMFAAVSGWRHA